MVAQYYDQITDEMISARLAQVRGLNIEWMGRVPAGWEQLDQEARERLAGLTAEEVRRPLLRHSLCGDDPQSEIDMAIAIACEPADMPDRACVALVF